ESIGHCIQNQFLLADHRLGNSNRRRGVDLLRDIRRPVDAIVSQQEDEHLRGSRSVPPLPTCIQESLGCKLWSRRRLRYSAYRLLSQHIGGIGRYDRFADRILYTSREYGQAPSQKRSAIRHQRCAEARLRITPIW